MIKTPSRWQQDRTRSLTCHAASLAWNATSHRSAARRRCSASSLLLLLPGDETPVGAAYSASSAGRSSLGIGDAIEREGAPCVLRGERNRERRRHRDNDSMPCLDLTRGDAEEEQKANMAASAAPANGEGIDGGRPPAVGCPLLILYGSETGTAQVSSWRSLAERVKTDAGICHRLTTPPPPPLLPRPAPHPAPPPPS